MDKRSVLLVAFVFGLVSIACQPPVQQADSLSTEDIASIKGRTEPYTQAMITNNWGAVAALYTEDAVRMPPNRILQQGRAAIQADLASSLGTVTDFALKTFEVDGRDGIAYARGSFSITIEREDVAEPISDSGKWLNILRKQPDGSWLISISAWNSDLPLPSGEIVTKESKTAD